MTITVSRVAELTAGVFRWNESERDVKGKKNKIEKRACWILTIFQLIFLTQIRCSTIQSKWIISIEEKAMVLTISHFLSAIQY